jgi:hypothetical protein
MQMAESTTKSGKKGQDTSIAGMADLSVSSVRILAQANRK